MTTLPTPHSTMQGRDWRGAPDRTYTTKWLTGEVTEDDTGETGVIVIELTTTHDKDRKVYRTSVVEAHQFRSFKRVEVNGANWPTIYVTPAGARFSAATLHAKHLEHVTRFTEGETINAVANGYRKRITATES